METSPTGNRILDAINFYLEEETAYRINNPYGSKKDRYGDILYKEFLHNVIRSYSRNLSDEEKNTRNVIKNEIRKVNAKINPSFVNILLNGRLTRWLLNQMFRNHNNIIAHRNIFLETVNKISLETNVEKLNEQMKAKGFHQNIEHVVQKSVNQGLPAFHLRYADVKNPKTDFVLHFKKIPGTGAYEFYKYDAAARPSWDQPTKLGDAKWQTFMVNIENSLTAGEAASLTSGRSIQKGEANQWLTINPVNQQIVSVHFDLEKSLKELPPLFNSPQQYKSIINGLKEGQSREISIAINGKPELFTIQANPIGQKIKVTDSFGRPVDLKLLVAQRITARNKAKQIIKYGETPVIRSNFRKKVR